MFNGIIFTPPTQIKRSSTPRLFPKIGDCIGRQDTLSPEEMSVRATATTARILQLLATNTQHHLSADRARTSALELIKKGG